jgi:hypothetical protein
VKTKNDPLMVTLLEQRAKANATKYDTGHALDGTVRCHYYPRSGTWGWWINGGKSNKSDVIEHYRFREAFTGQAS